MSKRYLARVIDQEIDELTELAALSIEGAKGVGKTATASQRAKTVHNLDDPAFRTIAQADPQRLLDGTPPILIDEWQNIPSVWDLVRRAVDNGAQPSQFLLTGSAFPRDLPAHSGAGRIVTLRMRPMALSERGIQQPTVSIEQLLLGDRYPLSGRSSITLEDYAQEIRVS